MPHLLTLLGPSKGAVLRRGAVKANLIHHLAHAGGAPVLTRLGKGFVPPRDWVPASGRTPSPKLAKAFDRALAVPTASMRRDHPSLIALDAFAAKGEFWAHVGLAFNLLRVWDGDASFRESLNHIDAALALEPDWAWGHLLRGEIRRSLIDYQGGAEDLRRAIALDPNWSWAHGFLARAQFQAATDEADLGPIDHAVRLGPRDGFLLCWRAEAYRRLGRQAEAARDFEHGLALDPSYDQGYGWRARLLDAQGRHEEAAASLRKGIALCPLFEKARRQLVRSLRGAGRTGEALRELDRAAKLNHRNDWLGVWRAEGQPDGASARQALAELDARPGDVRALAWKGETLVQIGRLPEALAVLDSVLKKNPSDAWAYAWRGEALLRLGRTGEALADLARATKLDPSYGRAWAWSGRAKLLSGDAKGAEHDLTKALTARRVEYAPISLWRGQARLALGKDALGRLDLAAAAALDHGLSQEAAAPTLWGDLPWRRILSAKKAADLNAVIAKHGKNASWLYLLRYRLKRAAGDRGALRDADQAFRVDPSCAWLAGLGDPPEGAPLQAKLLRDSLRSFYSETASAPVHAYHGQDLLKRGETGRGLAALERATRLEPAGWILAWLGEALRQSGRLPEAAAAFDRALTLDPKYDNAWAWRGTLKLAGGDAAGALADLDAALKLRSTARAHHDRARALRALGRIPESLDALETAVRLDAELGWAGRKTALDAAALDEIRTYRINHEDPRLAEWEGATRLRLGQNAEALSVLEGASSAWGLAWRGEARLALSGLTAEAAKDIADAARRDPKWAKTRALAAEAAFRSNDAKKALFHATAAVKLNPYSARLRELKAKILSWAGRRTAADAELAMARRLAPQAAQAEPKSLEFFVNYACNAKCPFCFNPPDATPELDAGLPLPELAKRLLTGWREGFRAVKFIGGEVTVRDDLPQILGLARKIGYRSVQLTTNGIRLADPAYSRMLVRLGVDRVRFSIHGHTPELHDKLVMVPGALAKIEKAAKTLKSLGVSLGVNYVLNQVNYRQFPDTLEWLYRTIGDDVIVYFIRYQGFGALPQNKELLRLTFSEAVPAVRAGFERIRDYPGRRPQLIHFAPCVAPELAEFMLDWKKDESEDLVTLPDGSGGLIREITNSGKRPVAACASCALKDRCHGIEANYAAEFGEGEFHPVSASEVRA